MTGILNDAQPRKCCRLFCCRDISKEKNKLRAEKSRILTQDDNKKSDNDLISQEEEKAFEKLEATALAELERRMAILDECGKNYRQLTIIVLVLIVIGSGYYFCGPIFFPKEGNELWEMLRKSTIILINLGVVSLIIQAVRLIFRIYCLDSTLIPAPEKITDDGNSGNPGTEKIFGTGSSLFSNAVAGAAIVGTTIVTTYQISNIDPSVNKRLKAVEDEVRNNTGQVRNNTSKVDDMKKAVIDNSADVDDAIQSSSKAMSSVIATSSESMLTAASDIKQTVTSFKNMTVDSINAASAVASAAANGVQIAANSVENANNAIVQSSITTASAVDAVNSLADSVKNMEKMIENQRQEKTESRDEKLIPAP